MYVIDWNSPPTVPVEVECGDALAFVWENSAEPHGLWVLPDGAL